MILIAMHQAYQAHQTVALIASNLAFLFPAWLAYGNNMLYEGTLYTIMALASSLYHTVDSSQVCLLGDHYCFHTAYFLDIFYSTHLIFSTAFLVFHPEGPDIPSNIQTANRLIKHIANQMCTMILVTCILEGVDDNIMRVIIGMCCVTWILLILIFMKAILHIRRIDWPDLSVAIVLTIVAIILFYTSNRQYWILHSLWHVVIAAALCFYIEARNRRWNLLWYLTFKRIESLRPEE